MDHSSSVRTSHWVNGTTTKPQRHTEDSTDEWDASDTPLDFSSKKVSPPAQVLQDDDDVASSAGSSESRRGCESPPASMANPHNFINPLLRHQAGPLDKLFPNGQKLPSFPFSVRAEPRTKGAKPIRPFKAYPKDSLSLPLGFYGLPMNFGLPTSLLDAVNSPQIFGGSEEAFLQYKRSAEAFYGSAGGKKGGATSTAGKPSRTNRRNPSGASNGIVSSSVKSRKSDVLKMPENESLAFSGSPVEVAATAADSTGLAMTASPQSVNRSESKSPGLDGELDEKGKKRGRSVPDEVKDEAYWERRRKNNEAAKRSRDSRRIKEDEIALKAAFLERENLTLRMEKKQLQAEVQKMRMIVYNSQ